MYLSFQDLTSNGFDADTRSRMHTMRRACKNHGLDKKGEDNLHQPNPWEYFIAETKDVNLVWCNIFKAASSRYGKHITYNMYPSNITTLRLNMILYYEFILTNYIFFQLATYLQPIGGIFIDCSSKQQNSSSNISSKQIPSSVSQEARVYVIIAQNNRIFDSKKSL